MMYFRTRIKVCGITRVEDGLVAAEAGVDAIGFVFWQHSPRAINVARARSITSELGPFLTVVGLFVDPDPAEVRAVLRSVRLGCLQFHGNETPEFCDAFGVPWIKALHAIDSSRLITGMNAYDRAQGVLIDSFDPVLRGGTGERFDWSIIPHERRKPLVLAGGLDAGNVADALRQVRPWAVDVSSGVESSPGIKDPQKIRAFVDAVGNATMDSHRGCTAG